MYTVKEDFISINGDIYFKGDKVTQYKLYDLSYREIQEHLKLVD